MHDVHLFLYLYPAAHSWKFLEEGKPALFVMHLWKHVYRGALDMDRSHLYQLKDYLVAKREVGRSKSVRYILFLQIVE
jgi:hypothetical protein